MSEVTANNKGGKGDSELVLAENREERDGMISIESFFNHLMNVVLI